MASKKSSFGCLFVFALPFAGVGVFMVALVGWNLLDAVRMQSWQKTPAKLTAISLEHHTDDEGSGSDVVVATYTYEVSGQSFQSDRVAISTSADNIGSFWKDLHDRLKDDDHDDRLVCYVDPGNPENAVLDRRIRWGLIAFKALFGAIFGTVGFGIMLGGVIARRRERKREHLLEENPQATWVTDPSWQSGVIRADRGWGGIILLPFALVWCGITVPAVIFGIPKMYSDGDHFGIFFVLLFPLIGIGLLIGGLRAVLRFFKYGRPVLQPQHLPIVQGSYCQATASGTRHIEPLGLITCTIICGQMVTSGTGKNRKTTEHIRWRHEWSIESDQLVREVSGWKLPLTLPVPSDAPASDQHARIAWRLEVRLPTTGIDFFAAFPLPVVVSYDESHSEPGLRSRDIIEADLRVDSDGKTERAYQKSGIRRLAQAQGLRLVSPPLRLRVGSITSIFIGLLMAAIAGGIGFVFGLASSDAIMWIPMIVGGLFALLGLSIAIGGLLAIFRTTHVEIDQHGIVIRSGILIPRNEVRLERSDIREIETQEVYSTNGVSKRRIIAITNDDSKHQLTPVVGNPEESEIVAIDIRKALGQ